MNVQDPHHGTARDDSRTRNDDEGDGARGPEPRESLLVRGPGRGGDHRGRPFAPGFRDARRTITVIASGPSAGSFRREHLDRFPAICVNDAWRLHPAAEALYAADPRWWEVHHEAIGAGWKGGRLFASHNLEGGQGPRVRAALAGRGLELELRRVVFEPGLSQDHGTLHAGGAIGNSGAQAINLAALAGAWRILLVGFDMRKVEGQDHFFGAHPPPLNQPSPYETFWKGMWSMAAALNEAGIEVLNASPQSALPYWPKLQPGEVDALCARTS